MSDQMSSDVSARVQIATSFLDRVLPAAGWRVGYIVHAEKKFNVFHRTNAELAAYLINADSQGLTAYHACSSFAVNQHDPRTTPRNQRHLGRTHHNVQFVCSFWLDVDAGPGKPYADAASAAEHVVEFCRWASLPAPIFVGSGNGLHVYWPLDQDVDPQTWLAYAKGLAALLHQFGLHVDTVRTCDLSSVLRTPGTFHRKQEPKLVQVGPLIGPYQLSQFEVLKHVTRQTVLPPLRQQRSHGGGLSDDLVGGIYNSEPRYADVVADYCAQIRPIRDNPGSINEPIFHAGIGVLHYCVDGADKLLEWIAPDWHAVVGEKLERASEFGPTTCAKFKSLHPSGCTGCKFAGRITSPVELGRRNRVQRLEAPADQAVNTSIGLAEQAGRQEACTAPPPDFAYGSSGQLLLLGEGKNGAETYDLISAYPIYLKAVHTSELDDDRHGFVFREYKPHRGWRDIIVSGRSGLGREAATELADHGVTIHHGDGWRKFVRASVDRWHATNMTETRYDQFGWKGPDFLVGKRLYTKDGFRNVSGSATLEQRSQYLQFPKAKGATYERWQCAANKMFAAGLEHQALALLCGFAAPLMRFHSEGEGGAIVSLISDKTSSGKTTALEAATSIWGHKRGLWLDDTDTRVAKGLKLGLLGNLPCAFDELHERDPELIRQFVLIFTNGVDKDRGTIEGGLRVNKADWQTILLVASNTSIVDNLANLDASDAPVARVFELDTALPENVAPEDFDAVRRELNFNHSFAGDAYMRRLVQPEILDWITQNIPTWTNFVRKEVGLSDRHRFWTRMIVSVIAAATIVNKLGILEFSVTRIRDWLFAEAAQRRDIIVGATAGDASSTLSTFMSEHRQDTLAVTKAYKSGQRVGVIYAPQRHLLCRYETEDKRLLISETHLKRWLVKKAVNIQGFVTKLKDQGVLIETVRKHTLGAGTDFASGQTPCYVVNMASPAVSGIVTTLEEAMPAKVPNTREERLQQGGL
jgi:hypothetical protein